MPSFRACWLALSCLQPPPGCCAEGVENDSPGTGREVGKEGDSHAGGCYFSWEAVVTRLAGAEP